MFGAVGAAIGSTVVLYAWNVPYNLVYLARQFNCGILSFFPWRKLGALLILSVISVVFAYASTAVFPTAWSLCRLVVGALVFGSIYLIVGIKLSTDVRDAVAMIPWCSRMVRK